VSEPFTRLYRACGFDRATTIANGVSDLSCGDRRPAASGQVRLAHVGGQSAHKGYHLLQAALKHGAFRNLVLTVVDHGRVGGPERREVWGETPVRFVGKTAQEQMSSFYAEQDVLLAPSIWPESYGLVTREALGCGLWVVAGDRGAIGEDVRPGVNGFVVDVSTPQALYDTLAAIDADAVRYQQPPPPTPLRGAKAQAAELLELYRTLLAAASVRPAPTTRTGGAASTTASVAAEETARARKQRWLKGVAAPGQTI
jgi:hypothetical protein